MSKKLTYDFVKSYFESQGCVLLESTYTDAKIKMKYICKCGNTSIINWNSFKQGQRCKKCGTRSVSEKRKHTYEYVRDYFKSEGCTLLDKKYINSREKMKYICSCGNESTIAWNSFKNGSRCKNCGYEKAVKDRRYAYVYVKEYFEKYGCVLLEDKYLNANTPMKYTCSCGNTSYITLSAFSFGGRCKSCGSKKISKALKKPRDSYEVVYAYFKDRGCELLESEYKDQNKRLKYRCSCGNVSYIQYRKFKEGQRCKKCFLVRKSANSRLSKEFVEKLFIDKGYILLDEYSTHSVPLTYKCDKGHIGKIRLDHFLEGQECSVCSGYAPPAIDYLKNYFKLYDCTLLEDKYKSQKTKMRFKCSCGKIDYIQWRCFRENPFCSDCSSSKGEKAVKDFLIHNNILFEPQKRFNECRNEKTLPFDFYLSDINLCIEFDGPHHFEPITFGVLTKEQAIEKHHITKLRDKIKNKFCMDQNIELIRIPYWEYKNIDKILSESLGVIK